MIIKSYLLILLYCLYLNLYSVYYRNIYLFCFGVLMIMLLCTHKNLCAYSHYNSYVPTYEKI